MIFIETTWFTKLREDYLMDDPYQELQNFLVEIPGAGDVIQGTGGLRKIRWSCGNKGKRGGVRVIYYWKVAADQIYLLTLYAKNETVALTTKDKKVLKQMIEGLSQ